MPKPRRVTGGELEETNGWLRMKVWGGPRQRGKANGVLMKDQMVAIMRMLDFTLLNTYGLPRSALSEMMGGIYGPRIMERFPEQYEEMLGMAEGSRQPLNDVILWNCYYTLGYVVPHLKDLVRDVPGLEQKYGELLNQADGNGGAAEGGGGQDRCTAFMAVGNYTETGKVVCGHNTFDNFIDSQYCNVILSVNPSRGNRFIMQTAPCQVSSGTDFYVSSAGLICTETTIGGFSAFRLGDPICCRIRRAVQYGKTLDDYSLILQEENGGDYANSWLVADVRRNEIMRIELGMRYVKIEKKRNGYFIGYNAPTDPRIRNLECRNTGYYDIRRHQGARRVRLTQLMEKYKGKITIPVGERILADHYDVYLNKINPCSRTCCSHYDWDAREFMSQSDRPKPFQPRGAMDGLVTDSALAAQMGFVGRWGSSCGTPFIAEDFCRRNIQWADQRPYLLDRPHQPWTVFTARQRRHTISKRKSVQGSRRRSK